MDIKKVKPLHAHCNSSSDNKWLLFLNVTQPIYIINCSSKLPSASHVIFPDNNVILSEE